MHRVGKPTSNVFMIIRLRQRRSASRVKPHSTISEVRRYSKMSKYGNTDIDVGSTRVRIDGCLDIGEFSPGNLQRAEPKHLSFGLSAQTAAVFQVHFAPINQESPTLRERRADQATMRRCSSRRPTSERSATATV
jgi:hypothetical protein